MLLSFLLATAIQCHLSTYPAGRSAEAKEIKSSRAEVEHEGEVTYYEKGKKLAVRIRSQVEITYDLSDTHKVYSLPPDLKVGDQVLCSEADQTSSTKIITITLKKAQG